MQTRKRDTHEVSPCLFFIVLRLQLVDLQKAFQTGGDTSQSLPLRSERRTNARQTPRIRNIKELLKLLLRVI